MLPSGPEGDMPVVEEGGPITVTLRDLDPERLDVDALGEAVEAAAAIAPDVDLRVVVSGDFENYVRERDSWAPVQEYVQDRLVGYAIGKIVECADGSAELLVDASVVDVDRDEYDSPTRTFVHEVLHLLIGRRGETLNGRRARLGYQRGSAIGSFAGMAGIAGEEFRVERALSDLGYPLPDHYRTELGVFVDAYVDSLRRPFLEWEATGEVIRFTTPRLAVSSSS